MQQCVFSVLWKVWHDFPSAVFAKARQFRLIPPCLKWINEVHGSLKVFHAPYGSTVVTQDSLVHVQGKRSHVESELQG